jgi:hexosaminidase
MNFKNRLLSVAICLTAMQSCNNEKAHEKSSMKNLIPKPVSVNATNDFFSITAETAIYVQSDSANDLHIAQWFADKLKPSTGFDLKASLSKETPKAGGIYLISAADSSLRNEGYELAITKEMIKITANKPAGWFYGLQTLRQLLPADVELSAAQKGPWEIATGTIP